MLGKLIKYEFKATGRVFLPLLGAMLVLSLFSKLFGILHLRTPMIIMSSISGSFMAVVCVVCLVLVLQRFRRNLLRDEGYLMFTLPAGVDSLIWSKLIVATIWTIVSTLIMALGVMIMSVSGEDWSSMFRAFREILHSFNGSDMRVFLLTLELIVTTIVIIFTSILLFYASMSLSLLVNRHRGGFTFVAFCVFCIILQVVIGVVAQSNLMEGFSRSLQLMQPYTQVQSVMGVTFIVSFIPGVIFYFITRYMLRNKLNLE